MSHIFPDEQQELHMQGELIAIEDKPSRTLHIYRVKERFLDPQQHVIDKHCLNDSVDWFWHDKAEPMQLMLLDDLGVERVLNREDIGIQLARYSDPV